jgi:hypothetical protein
MPAFPAWLPLPPKYLVQDWIRLEKGRVIAQKLRENPALLATARNRLMARGDSLSGADIEWLHLLDGGDVAKIAEILQAADEEGQRLRSSMPFVRAPFITPEELEAIHERAYAD